MATDWVESLKSVTEADLASLDGRASALRDELTALNLLRGVFRAKLGIKVETIAPKPRRPTTPPLSSNGSGPVASPRSFAEHREKAAKLLLHSAVMRHGLLATECAIPAGSLNAVLDHEWFKRTPEGVVLTPAGRATAELAARR